MYITITLTYLNWPIPVVVVFTLAATLLCDDVVLCYTGSNTVSVMLVFSYIGHNTASVTMSFFVTLEATL